MHTNSYKFLVRKFPSQVEQVNALANLLKYIPYHIDCRVVSSHHIGITVIVSMPFILLLSI